MKSPEDIKKGLEACGADECHGMHVGCPYNSKSVLCIQNVCADALEYIRQLEDTIDQIDARIAGMCGKLAEMMHALEDDLR